MKRTDEPTWQPLLFRQVCLLAGMAGLLCCRFPLHGLAALLALALFTLPSIRAERSRPLFFLIFFLAGFGVAFFAERRPLLPEQVPAWAGAAVTPNGENTHPSFDTGVALSGIIRENTPLSGNRTRIILDAVHAANESAPLPGALVLTWQSPPRDLAGAGAGQTLSATLRIREIRGFANPGVWETERYWRDQGAYFRAWSRGDGTRNGKAAPYILGGKSPSAWTWREAARSRVIAALADKTDYTGQDAPQLSQPAAIIPALLFGDRSFCSPEMLDLVAKATLAHSLALSGMHLGFAAGLGYGAAYLLSFLFPTLFLRLPRQKAGLLMALPLAAAYLWLGGAPPSLQRAALMLLFWGVLLWLNRPKVLLDGLIWAVTVILVFSPAALYDIRLQLSAVSVTGIALAAPLLGRVIRKIRGNTHGRPGLLRYLACAVVGMTGVSVAAQLAVLPLVLDAFPGTGFWFPLNLLWLPVLGFFVMPLSFAGLLLSCLGLTGAASGVFSLAEMPCAALLSLLQTMHGFGVLISPVALRPAWPAMAGYWMLLLLLPIICTTRAFPAGRCFSSVPDSP
ncbi:competence protein ComEC family protein [Desulfovibrio sp. OttesenSCG-928-O18]|nr:competence protein ComEC family protein [Desulfovibrio sp. OttesenSCG-928-O18]